MLTHDQRWDFYIQLLMEWEYLFPRTILSVWNQHSRRHACAFFLFSCVLVLSFSTSSNGIRAFSSKSALSSVSAFISSNLCCLCRPHKSLPHLRCPDTSTNRSATCLTESSFKVLDIVTNALAIEMPNCSKQK